MKILLGINMAAAPVLFLALWARAVRGQLESAAAVPASAEPALRRIRIAGICAFAAQVAAYVANLKLRVPEMAAAILFLLGLLLQSQIKFGLERVLRRMDAKHGDQARLMLLSLCWLLASIAVYAGIVQAWHWSFALLGRQLGLPAAGVEGLRFFGIVLGVFCGLVVSYACAPLYFRKVMPTSPLADPGARGVLTRAFERAGLRLPEVLVLELDHFQFHNAMVTGFRLGRGWWRPALLITRSLLTRFTPAELEAIVLHEAAHVVLHHMRRRLLFSFAAVVGTTLVAVAVAIPGFALLPTELRILPMLAASLAPILLPLHLVRRQTREQESEADVFAALTLNANFNDLVSALRKLDQLNDLGAANPTTEHRIQVLERKLRARADDRERKAA